MANNQDALLGAVRRLGREMAREDDGPTLIRSVVGLMREQAGFQQVWMAHWDGRQLLGEGREGAGTFTDLPPCLSRRGDCRACHLHSIQPGPPCLVPLLTQNHCHGALLLNRGSAETEDCEVLREFAEDLACALNRLQRLRELTQRELMRREVEELGQSGGREGGGLKHSHPDSQAVLQEATRREEVEQELRASRQKLNAIFERAGIGLAECHSETNRFRRVNQKLCEILGFTAPELLSKCWQDLTHPDDHERDRRRAEDFRQGRLSHAALEKRYLCKDGSYVWVRITIVPKVDLNCFILSVEDIGERHAAQQALQEQQKRLATIFDLMLAGIIIVRRSDRRVIQTNPAMERLLEWSAAEMQGKTLLEMGVLPGSSDDFLEPGEGVSRGECRLRRKSGGEIQCLMTSGAAKIDGEACAISIWHDITELRQSDAALLESDRQARVMFQMAPVGIALGDPASGRILAANDRYCAITGYSLEELQTMTVSRLNHPEDRDLSRPFFLAGMRGEISEFHVDKRYLRKDGSVAWVRIDVSFLRDSQGRPERTLAVVEDVTKAKEAEQKLSEAQQQLLAAQKMEAIGRLAGGIAHDFNNLLTVILSYTELVMEELPASGPLREDLQEVFQAGTRAKSLTRQLLAFSRRQVMTLETLDLNALVVSVERMLVRLLGVDIEIMVELDSSPLPVRADRSQLEQVLLNLAVNARDAMPEGGRLRLASRPVQIEPAQAADLALEAGDFAFLEISDTGCGMSKEVQARIFEPFYTTKGMGQGTGLGLAMVYGIMRQTGGAIELESQEGIGTCFRLYVPAARTDQPLESALTREPCLRGGHGTLLVVEDEPALLQLVQRTLSSEGYRVFCARNGPEALALCEADGERFDLVLSDVIMPGMSGPVLFSKLRCLCPKARFLLMSGYPDDALAGQGIWDYLSKPFDAPALREAVRSVLKG